MEKTFKRAVSLFLTVAMTFGLTQSLVLAEAPPNSQPDLVVEDGTVSPGAFYIGSSDADVDENGGSYLLKVKRAEGGEGADSVKLIMLDMTAAYGSDYTVCEYKGDSELENEKESKSLLEAMEENSDSAEEYNDTDLVADGEADDLQSTEVTESEFNELVTEYLAENSGETAVTQDTIEEAAKDPLDIAWEKQTGLTSDRQPMDGTNASMPSLMGDMLSDLTSELNSTAIILNFEEGETEKLLQIKVKDNSTGDGDKMSNFTLSPLTETADVDATYGSICLNIIDDEPLEKATVGFESTEFSANDGAVKVFLKRDGALATTVSVRLMTENDTANAGRDYSMTDTVVTFPFGVQERHISIPIQSEYFDGDEARFKLVISEPSGCEVEGGEAYGIIRKTDESYKLSDDDESEDETDANGERYEEKISWEGAFSEVTKDSKGYARAEGTNWVLYPEYGWKYLAWTNYALSIFNLSTKRENNKIVKVYDTPFYKGIKIDWHLYNSGNRYATTKVYDKAADSDFSVIWSNEGAGIGSGASWDQQHIIYFDKPFVNNVKVYIQRHAWHGSPKLTLRSIEPIKKPITVNLLTATPLQFLDENGNLKPNTDIKKLQYATNAEVVNDTLSVNERCVGDTVSVLANKNVDNFFTTLKSLSMVKNDKSKQIINSGGKATSILEFKIESNDFWNETMRPYYTAEASKMNFDIKPEFDYIDSVIKVYDDSQADKRGYITVNDGHKLSEGTDEKGHYTSYKFHKGDYIRFTEVINEKYKGKYEARQIHFDYTDINLKRPSGETVLDKDNVCVFFNDGVTLDVLPVFTPTGNKLTVKVKDSEVSLFKDKYGIFNCDYTLDSGYRYYTVVKPEDFYSRQNVLLSAACLDENNVPIWGTEYSKETYCQDDYTFYTSDEASKNIVTLTCEKASDILPFCYSGRVVFDDIPPGTGQSIGTRPAAGAVIASDEMHKTIVDESSGKGMTSPMHVAKGENRYVQCYVKSGSDVKYVNVPVNENNATIVDYKYEDSKGEVQTIKSYCCNLGDFTLSPINTNVPYIQHVNVSDKRGISNNILINNENATLTAYFAQDGVKYKDSKGVERVESVKSVDFIVIDGKTKQQKFIIKGAQKNGLNWSHTQQYMEGIAACYYAGDKIYVRVTTDRYVGDGKIYDMKTKQYVEADALKQTVYPLVATTITFTQSIQKEPVDQDFDVTGNVDKSQGEVQKEYVEMPFVQNLISEFDFGPFKLDLRFTEDGLYKMSVGKTISLTKILNKKDDGKIDDDRNPDEKLIEDAKSGGVVPRKGLGLAGGFFSKPDIYVGFSAYIYLKQSDKTGVYEFVGFGGSAGIGFTFRGAIYWTISGFPVYLGFDLLMESIVGFEGVHIAKIVPTPADLVYKEDTLKNNFKFRFQSYTYCILDVYGGIGLAKVIGVRGGCGFNPRFLADPTVKKFNPKIRSWGFKFSIDAKFWLDLLLCTVTYCKNLVDIDRGYYADIKELRPNDDELSEPELTLNMKQRGEASSWVGGREENGSFKSAKTYVLQSGGYDRPTPKLMDMGDGKILLVYLDDDGTKNSDSRTTLKYSIYDNGVWGNPKTVYDNGTADFQPSLCDAGDKIVITWISRDTNAVLNKETDLLKDTNVFTADLDKKTGTISNVTKITDDSYYNYAPTPVYNSETGDLMVFYMKSTVTDDYIQSAMPTVNNSKVVYMLYDNNRGCWARDYYYENELADPSQEQYLIDNFGGQRFMNLSNDEIKVTDPNVVDFVAMGCGRYIAAAYTVDEDNNTATSTDRKLYIQVYDGLTHKTFKPVRVTKNQANVGEGKPKFVSSADGTIHLFWVENEQDVGYTDVTDFIKNGMDENGGFKIDERIQIKEGEEPSTYDFERGNVFFGRYELNSTPNLASYEPFVDANSNIYISWQQKVDNGLEIFASALIGNEDNNLSEEEIPRQPAAWSRGVQLTNNGRVNDDQALVVTSDNKMMIVNDSFILDMSSADYNVTDMKLLATLLTPTGSLEVPNDMDVTNKTPNPNETVAVSFNIENTGLTNANGYSVKVIENIGGVENEVFSNDSDDVLVPSSQSTVKFKYTIPDSLEKAKNMKLIVKVKENGMEDEFVKEMTPFEFKPVYTVSNSEPYQTDDGIFVKFDVTNSGNTASNADDNVVISYSNLFNNFEETGEVFYQGKVGDIQIGETKGFDVPLTISDERLEKGVTLAHSLIEDNDGGEISNKDEFDVVLQSPLDMTLNGSESGVSVKVGSSVMLKPEFVGAEYFVEPEYAYEIGDCEIARVDDGILTGLSIGETTVKVKTIPYGGEKTFTVNVTKKASGGGGGGGSTIDATPKPTATPTAEPTVTPTAEPTQAPAKVFTDVKSTDWFYDAVNAIVGRGLMNGVSDTEFAPNTNITRAMFVTMLYRLEGEPAFMNDNVFKDVPNGAYYEKAVVWASGKDIVKGVSDDKFAPDDFITREQIAAILYRYANYKGIDVEKATADTNTLSYNDVFEISDWAASAVHFCLASGILNGDENGNINPKKLATRAETATMLNRYIDVYPNN